MSQRQPRYRAGDRFRMNTLPEHADWSQRKFNVFEERRYELEPEHYQRGWFHSNLGTDESLG